MIRRHPEHPSRSRVRVANHPVIVERHDAIADCVECRGELFERPPLGVDRGQPTVGEPKVVCEKLGELMVLLVESSGTNELVGV